MSKEQKEKELEALRQKLEGGSPNDGLAVIEAANPIKVTVGEILAAVEANPSHPKSQDFKKAVIGMPSSYEVSVEGLDLTAILENKEVISYSEIMETDKGPRTVYRKKLGDGFPQPVEAQPFDPGFKPSREQTRPPESMDPPPSTPEALEDCPCPEPCPDDEGSCSGPDEEEETEE